MPWSGTPTSAEAVYKAAGLIKTKGTVFILPPKQDVLIAAFNSPPRPKTLMSAGAVALCKHFERGGASSEHGKPHPYWPLPKGSNNDKNQIAKSVLEEMLKTVAWRNMLMLHPGIAVYEIRNHLGYGMRWTVKVDTESTEVVKVEIATNEMSEATETTETTRNRNMSEDRPGDVVFRGFLEPIIGLDNELE